MLLHCHSRKCNTTRDHKLKIDSNDIVCMDCGETNNMVSDFMKNAMKSSGDIYRAAQGRKAFMYKCPQCTVDRGVKIVDEKALCETCLHPLNLSIPMIEAIKTTAHLSGASDEVKQRSILADEEAPKTELNKGVVKRHKE